MSGAGGAARGYAVGAMVLGSLGAALGLAWFTYLVSVTAGAVALAFAVAALRGAAGPRTRGLALTGGALGLIAVALAVYGFTTFLELADESATPEALVPEPQER